jgi:tRNA threonylcarbamoyladenosine biosynthesis protein TsaE
LTQAREIFSASPEETFQCGYDYADTLEPGDIVIFTGPLGSGKTQFIKGICSYFDIKEPVNSPTFIIVNEYEGIRNGNLLNISHFDLYRINSPKELDEIGLESYFGKESICLVEWGETASEKFPDARRVMLIYGENENERVIRLL